MSDARYREFRVAQRDDMHPAWDWLRDLFREAFDQPKFAPYVVCVMPHGVKRTNAQNARWWAMLGDIAAQVAVNGRQYEPEAWAEHFKRKFLPLVDMPHGPPRTMSTTECTVKQMCDLQAQVEVDAREMGVVFSHQQGVAK